MDILKICVFTSGLLIVTSVVAMALSGVTYLSVTGRRETFFEKAIFSEWCVCMCGVILFVVFKMIQAFIK